MVESVESVESVAAMVAVMAAGSVRFCILYHPL
jgi:hypothetical protein